MSSSHTPPFATNYAAAPSSSRKVAIPRLQRPNQGQSNVKERRRVHRACTACRSHKIKCSGDSPQCKHCESTGRPCLYIMPRKDKLKIVTQRCVELAGLLNGLRTRASNEDNAKITDLLDLVEEDVSEIRQTPTQSNPDTDPDESRESSSFAEQLDHVDTDALDLVDEDLQKDDRARATGFVGKNSEIQWLRTVGILQAEQNDEEPAHAMPGRRPSRSSDQVCSYTYWLDTENVDLNFIDPDELPALEIAERLLSCYMTKVHDSFPILPQKLFQDQFRRYFKAMSSGTEMRLSARWRAIVNLVFAIGAKYSHLTRASWRADDRDHLIYQARARSIGLKESARTGHADIPQVQVLGLLAFYWLSIGQASRAWSVMGTALRTAYALGLHVRNEDPSASATKREMLVRIWWSLYSLERQLSVITGRPSIIVDLCCSVPLPLPVTEDQITDDIEAAFRMRKPGTASSMASSATSPTVSSSSGGMVEPPRTPVGLGTTDANPGSYFKAVVQLGIITQNILTSLYSAGTMIRSPSEIQHTINQLNQCLEQWLTSLPSEFSFQGRQPPSSSSPVFPRQRMILGFQFCSARILLTRPCLSGTSQSGLEGGDGGFIKRMGRTCVETARMAVDSLPNKPDPTLMYEHGPWWTIVHHLMQAVSIFLLHLSYSSPGLTPQEHVDVSAHYVKKIIRWLRAMQDPVAERAYYVALSSFEGVVMRLGIDITDLWIEDSMAFPNRGPQQAPTAFGVSVEGMPPPFPPGSAAFSVPAVDPGMATFAPLDTSMFPSQGGGGPMFEGPYFHR